ncbi:ribosomal protein S5 domain 2-type protein [Elsinoe ampelina]|uniref:Ribosomal protein S5 domain 2-type protein n=1 Tax=Elsinoe ampelina TaxID=302913 RepID=A0A6A6G5N6_9PEZI|nr:ribosomal protein S5 domain 2-type protein [Elsinoe ampelina]
MTVPEAKLGPLHRADGSATYSHAGYSVICAVNGPVEVQRRDELPDEAAIEVNVRPAVGVGGPRERHLETLIHSTVRHIILTHLHPRTLIQITLQILSLPETESDLRSSSHIHLLPPLLNTTSLALLHASIPLSTTLTSTIIALPSSPPSHPSALSTPSSGTAPILDPSPAQILQAKSVHVFAFSSKGEVLLAASEGGFGVEEWEGAEEVARVACLATSEGQARKGGGHTGRDGDVDMDMDDSEGEGEGGGGVSLDGNVVAGGTKDDGGRGGIIGVLSGAVEEKAREVGRWRA